MVSIHSIFLLFVVQAQPDQKSENECPSLSDLSVNGAYSSDERRNGFILEQKMLFKKRNITGIQMLTTSDG